MFKRIGISVLILLGVLVAMYVATSGLAKNFYSMQSYREIDKNYLMICLRYILFGIVLGVPIIIREFARKGKWIIDLSNVVLPIVLLIFAVIPFVTKDYVAQKFFFFDVILHWGMPFLYITFGYSLTLLINRTEK